MNEYNSWVFWLREQNFGHNNNCKISWCFANEPKNYGIWKNIWVQIFKSFLKIYPDVGQNDILCYDCWPKICSERLCLKNPWQIWWRIFKKYITLKLKTVILKIFASYFMLRNLKIHFYERDKFNTVKFFFKLFSNGPLCKFIMVK